MFNFDPYCVKRNEQLNKEFWSNMFFIILICILWAVLCMVKSLLIDKSQETVFQSPSSEYAVTIDGVTEYWSLYVEDGVYYNTDKEMVFDASGDASLIYTDGQCTGKSTNYTIRLKN